LLPSKEIFVEWHDEHCNEVYFSGMKQIAKNSYVGVEVATETLRQRFHNLSQRKFNPVTRKMEYATVAEYHTQILQLVDETQHMDAATVLREVPELDQCMYQGMISRLKERQALAAMVVHPASTNMGENMDRLQTFVNAAKIAEAEV